MMGVDVSSTFYRKYISDQLLKNVKRPQEKFLKKGKSDLKQNEKNSDHDM